MVESLSKRLQGGFDALGKQEKAVARALLRDYPVSALSTVAALAEAASVSTATVLRLVNRLGYETFGVFQDAVKQDLKTLLQSPSDRFAVPQEDKDFRQSLFEKAAENLLEGAKTTLDADFRDVVDLLADPKRRIYCIGGRYSRHIANLFVDYLGVLRDQVRFVEGQPDGWSRYLIDIGPQSVVVAIDIRRYQRTLRRFASLAKGRGAKLVVITDLWADRTHFDGDYELRLPGSSPSLMDSLAPPLVMVEALTGAVAVKLAQSIRGRLADCEALDCVETNLPYAWPGIAGERDQD